MLQFLSHMWVAVKSPRASSGFVPGYSRAAWLPSLLEEHVESLKTGAKVGSQITESGLIFQMEQAGLVGL